MPEMSVASAADAPADELPPPELPDPAAALDLLGGSPSEPIVEDIVQPPIDDPIDLLNVLDQTALVQESEDELNVANYKWKDTVLEPILIKFEISDRDAFLVHATAYDENKNMYLSKKELTKAAQEWVELSSPIAEMETVIESVPDITEDTNNIQDSLVQEIDAEEVVIEEVATPLELPPLPEAPPMPEPAPMELPPLPEAPPLPDSAPMELPPLPEAPPLPDSAPMELPPLPAPAPESTVEVVSATDESSDITVEEDQASTEDYRELWKRRSDKSLPQMYGAIDRIGSGEIGSLLDRYSDRFGHELDREIIVMRRAEQDARREAVPVVELISSPDDDSEADDGELSTQLKEVEDILRPLQKTYKSTDDKAEKKRLAPALKALIAERKILLGVISGDLEEDELENIPERPDIPGMEDEDDEIVEVEVEDDDTDQFAEFFEVINQLLGKMPEKWVDKFVKSKGFTLFQKIGDDPEGTSEKNRKKFFVMINDELVTMPQKMLDEFVNSPEFELFQQMGEIYGD
jgi:hypothetical protein